MAKEDTQFKPGQSGNPNGRPKSEGLSGYIQAKTKGGKVLADFWLDILSSTDRKVSMDHKLKAAQELADRGFGKPLQPTDVTSGGKPITKGYIGFTPDEWDCDKGPE